MGDTTGQEWCIRRWPLNPRQPYNAWYEIVQLYATRELTIPDDRLPAIAGIARPIHSATDDQYYAGLWRNDLLTGLLWTADYTEWKRNPPSDYTEPSWSWVSVWAGISFSADYNAPNIYSPIKDLAHVKDVLLEHVSPSIYGSLTGGKLIITGPCYACNSISAEVAEVANISSPRFQQYLSRVFTTTKEFQARHKPYTGQMFVALQIRDVQGGYCPKLLILEAMGDDSMARAVRKGPIFYRRIGHEGFYPYTFGYTETHEEPAYDEMLEQAWPMETVTII